MTTATLYEIRQGAAWITLNRPENRNALSAQLVNELDAHLIAAIADPAVRCIVLTGTGQAFCAGGDVKGMAAAGSGAATRTVDEAIHQQRHSQRETDGGGVASREERP